MLPSQRALVLAAALVGFAAAGAPALWAAPYTPHFDGLMAQLGAAAATLEGSAEKADQKRLKGIQKVLKTLREKASTSLATDIAAFGKTAKGLGKLFPAELSSPADPVTQALDAAAAGLGDEVLGVIDAAETLLAGGEGAAGSGAATTCASKASASLDLARGHLEALGSARGALDFVGASAALKAGLKAALKGDKTARSKACSGSNGNGNGNGNGGCDIGGATEYFAMDVTGPVNSCFGAVGLEVGSTYDSFVDGLTVYAADNSKLLAVVIAIRNPEGPGEYPLHGGASFTDLSAGKAYGVEVTGTVFFDVLDFEKPEAAGRFEILTLEQLVPAGETIVTLKSGRFRALSINGRPE